MTTEEELKAARRALVYAVGMANGLLMILPEEEGVRAEISRAMTTLEEARRAAWEDA